LQLHMNVLCTKDESQRFGTNMWNFEERFQADCNEFLRLMMGLYHKCTN